ncbi:MAG: hypothetical protein Q9164_002907 [Protoblastenia rupestris]
MNGYMSVLVAVAELESFAMITLLVEHGAKIKRSGALVIAAGEGKMKMVEFLLEKGPDIDEIGIKHPTDDWYEEDMGSALHKAIDGGHEEVGRFLKDEGADVSLKDIMGRTSLILAQAKQDEKMVELLKSIDAS